MPISDKSPSLRRAIDMNPCAMCRATGMPFCKGHGNGGGSASEDRDGLAEVNKWLQPGAMFESGLLLVKSEFNTLSFVFNADLSVTENAIWANAFANAVRVEFDEFKDELDENGISIKNFTVTDQENALTLSLPKEYTGTFIQRLMSQGLLFAPNVGCQQEEDVQSEEKPQQIPSFCGR